MKNLLIKLSKFVNQIYVFICILFGFRYNVDTKKYRRNIHGFYNLNESLNIVSTITNVKVQKQKGITYVIIETHRPEIIIGRRGSYIDELKQFLKEELNENISIYLIESKLWHNMY